MPLTAEQRIEYARELGSMKSEKKAAAARENGKKGGAKIKPLEAIPCNCRGEELNHASTCRRGVAIYLRRKKGLPLT